MRFPLASLLLSATLALAVPAFAQTMVVKTIDFTGTTQSQAELLTLSGLTPGKTYGHDDIEAAMHRLDESGLFSNIQWSSKPGELHFTLEAAAATDMQRVRYANFVWWTQAELTEAVHHKFPLFTGSVPSGGAMKDQVAEILKALVKEHGVDATVEAEPVAGGGMEYKIVNLQVVVSDLQIQNIRWESDPVLESVRKSQIGIDYMEGVSQRAAHENLSYALKELGFLDESVGAISHSEPKADGNHITVMMTGTATPGDRYKVGHVTLPSPVGDVKASELESDHQVKTGGAPSPSLADNTVARMAFVYQGHGFLDAKSSVETSKDSVAHTVNYVFTVVPGEVYHVRDVVYAQDVSADQKAQFQKAWKFPQGAVYDRTQVQRAVMEAKLCGSRPASQKLLPSAATHQVDISVSCSPQR